MSNYIEKINHQSLLVFVLVYGQYTVQCTIFLCGNIFPIPNANVKKLTVTVRRSKRTRFTFFPFRLFSFHILLYTVLYIQYCTSYCTPYTVLYILLYTVSSTVYLTVHRTPYVQYIFPLGFFPSFSFFVILAHLWPFLWWRVKMVHGSPLLPSGYSSIPQ